MQLIPQKYYPPEVVGPWAAIKMAYTFTQSANALRPFVVEKAEFKLT